MTGVGGDRSRRKPGERGAVLVLVAVLLVALIGFGSLVFDMGQLYTVRGELQNTTDSASLAGALVLDGTEEGLERAREQVQEYAQRHRSDFRSYDIADEDIIFGQWNPVSETFSPRDPLTEFEVINAVRVRDRRDDEGGNPVMLRLAPVIGHTQGNVATQAVAISGGPAVECGFPMAVPSCSLEAGSGPVCGECLVFSPGQGSDQNALWIDLADDQNANDPGTYGDQIKDACPSIDSTTGQCVGADQCRTEVFVGSERQVNVGDHLNKGNKNAPCEVIMDLLTRGGEIPEGAPFVVPVPVFEESSCSGTLSGGARTIVGYASLTIHGVSCGGGNNPYQLIEPNAPTCHDATPNDKYVLATLDCESFSDKPPGGGHFGLDTRRSRLVQ